MVFIPRLPSTFRPGGVVLPRAPQGLGPNALINAFNQGADRMEAQQDKARERNALLDIGAAAAEGDMTGAQNRAFGHGKLDVGLAMQRAAERQRMPQAKPSVYAQRAEAARAYGLDPKSPEGRRFILSGDFSVGQGAGGATYGRSGAIFQGQDGGFYTVQFGSDGSRRILPVETGDGEGLSPSRGVVEVGDQLVDKATGAPVRSIGQNIAEAERQKVAGKKMGEGEANWGKTQMAFQMFDNKSQRLQETIDRAMSRIGPLTTGPGSALQYLPATEARALRGDLDTIRANIGFEELQAMRDASPTGGALGQVSEMENRLLQSLRAAIDQAMSGRDLQNNLGIIRQSVQQIRELQQQKFQADAARFGGQQADLPSGGLTIGQTFEDPETGIKIEVLE